MADLRGGETRVAVVCALLALGGPAVRAQRSIGSVAVQDATVSGALEVTGGRAVLVGTSTVTARDHVAEVKLDRGGVVRICQTSGLHLASSGTAATAATPLMLALDRGAIEVTMQSPGNDVILTPDLRLTVKGPGKLDLRLRVTPNGDTCVEQRGANGPALAITDSFGEASYELHAGQHVMFEHGSLREVVDHETSPCGCPPATMSLAEASLAPNGPAPEAEQQHPFPAAQSTGLAPEAEVPQATAGTVHTQVASTLTFDAGATPAPALAAVLPPTPPAPAKEEQPHRFGHALGHFFHRLFGGS